MSNYENVFRSPTWMINTILISNLGKYAGIVIGLTSIKDLNLIQILIGAIVYAVSDAIIQVSKLQHYTNGFSELEENIKL